eukprot:m.169362 g.169362  ORF g.169362 m.169362 type:complete len:769 (+) comp13092_c0_seq1:110-2416(+)
MDFASSHVFQPKTADEAYEEVDEEELASSWSTSSPVLLASKRTGDKVSAPSKLRRGVDVADASGERASANVGSADGIAGAAPGDDGEDEEDDADDAGTTAEDASRMLQTLQSSDYAGFSRTSAQRSVSPPVPPAVERVAETSGARTTTTIRHGSMLSRMFGLAPPAESTEDAAAPPAESQAGSQVADRRAQTLPADGAQAKGGKLKLRYARTVRPDRVSAGRRREVDTNVVSIKLGSLVQDSQVHSGECAQCSTCSAVLSHYSKLTGPPDARVWTCEFCGTDNPVDLDDEELPTANTIDYILKPAPCVTASDSESNVVFCVDTSGSMCVTTAVPGRHKFRGSRTDALRRSLSAFNDDGSHQRLPGESRGVEYVSRLQAVQAAVESQLNRLVTEHPNARCGLVTFSSDVALVGDGSQATATLAGDALATEAAVRDGASAHSGLLTQPIKSSAKLLVDKVFDLEEGGQTALGPAVCAAIELASTAPGSRVVICTDGLANVGVGTLEDEADIPAARAFYTSLAEHALSKGVSVSIVTIDGTEADLDSIECLSDRTGGDIEIVDPLHLADNFTSMLTEPVIASKVEVTMKLHKGLCFRNEDADPSASTLTRQIGNVNRHSETMFEFKVGDADLNVDELPFQVQIRYTTPTGMEALRVVSQLKPVTRNRAEALKTMNVAMCAARATQVSSELASKGRVDEARLNSRAWRHTMASTICSEEASAVDQRQYANFLSANADIESTYEAPSARGGRRSDSSSRWQYKGKKATMKHFM